MSNPLVSICVPVYNVAPYIERCVRSLMEQDYTNIEYVFVNDGSTDNSIEVLEQVLQDYPKRLPFVQIYHNDRNHGLAYTRRATIEKAAGDYVACVDSDDWVDTNYLSALVKQAVATKADMVACLWTEYWNERKFIHPASVKATNIYSKLIRRQLMVEHHCFAPEGLDYGEDRIAMLQVYHYAERPNSVSDTSYHYVHQSNSITANKTDKHFECLIRYWQEAERLMREWEEWERCADRCRQEQVEDKIALMLQCRSMATRRKYADLYREYEIENLKDLSPGFQLMGRLVHHHAWPLISLYQIYIDWLIRRKNK